MSLRGWNDHGGAHMVLEKSPLIQALRSTSQQKEFLFRKGADIKQVDSISASL